MVYEVQRDLDSISETIATLANAHTLTQSDLTNMKEDMSITLNNQINKLRDELTPKKEGDEGSKEIELDLEAAMQEAKETNGESERKEKELVSSPTGNVHAEKREDES